MEGLRVHISVKPLGVNTLRLLYDVSLEAASTDSTGIRMELKIGL